MSTLEREIAAAVEPRLELIAERVARRVVEEARGEDEGYKSVRNAALLLDVSEETIRAWIKQGRVRKYKAGNCVRVKISELIRAA